MNDHEFERLLSDSVKKYGIEYFSSDADNDPVQSHTFPDGFLDDISPESARKKRNGAEKVRSLRKIVVYAAVIGLVGAAVLYAPLMLLSGLRMSYGSGESTLQASMSSPETAQNKTEYNRAADEKAADVKDSDETFDAATEAESPRKSYKCLSIPDGTLMSVKYKGKTVDINMSEYRRSSSFKEMCSFIDYSKYFQTDSQDDSINISGMYDSNEIVVVLQAPADKPIIFDEVQYSSLYVILNSGMGVIRGDQANSGNTSDLSEKFYLVKDYESFYDQFKSEYFSD